MEKIGESIKGYDGFLDTLATFLAKADAAMAAAVYEKMGNGQWFGSTPLCVGAWTTGKTQQACATDLRAVIEEWLLIDLTYVKDA